MGLPLQAKLIVLKVESDYGQLKTVSSESNFGHEANMNESR